MQILLATRNDGKLAEFRQLLGDDVEIVSLDDVNLPSPPEDGDTFEANAVIKARTAARESGRYAVADDSGLVVDALAGEPGVRSARFAGPDASDEDNRSLLLARLRGVESDKRTSRFVSVIAVCRPDGHCETFRGEWTGRVALEPRGSNGFGYDPLFQLADGRTAAELEPQEKNAFSHRARALESALPYLRSVIRGQR